MAKKLVNIILILVLIVTVLPIKQVGKALFNNQWTEEVSDHAETETRSDFAKWTFLNAHIAFAAKTVLAVVSSYSYLVYCQRLPSLPASDIYNPPPDLHL